MNLLANGGPGTEVRDGYGNRSTYQPLFATLSMGRVRPWPFSRALKVDPGPLPTVAAQHSQHVPSFLCRTPTVRFFT